MKYRLLTKEQFEELNFEFSKFLASQKIDKDQWEDYKKDNPKIVAQELEIFSDMVWDSTLEKVEYLEHYSEKSFNLFRFEEKGMSRILVEVNKEGINLIENEGFDWFIKNNKDSCVEYSTGFKKYSKGKKQDAFDLIEMGSVISEGNIYKNIEIIISEK
ncbi:MAG: hypothetical protein HRT66_08565 [Flavobacteriaceae bacterium]|nr:hypothetical protein [Flavobacteriaceae bacterium]